MNTLLCEDITREMSVSLTDSGRQALRALAAHLRAVAACCDAPDLVEICKRTQSAAALLTLIADGETEVVIGAMPRGMTVVNRRGERPS